MAECFFAHLGNCEGRLVKAHLIPKQRIKREFANGAWRFEGEETWRRMPAVSPGGPFSIRLSDYEVIAWDPRAWTWMCGGPTGIGGHHGAFDAKQLRIDAPDLPLGVFEFAKEYGLEWSLERDYV